MEIRVDRAVRADAADFLELVDALADYEELDRPVPAARERLIHDAFGPSPRFSLFIGRRDGQAVGYAVVFETYSTFLALPTLYLEDLFVRPDARGIGMGKALFVEVEREAVRRGCGRLEWECLNWNQLAIGFYERRQAVHREEWRHYRLTDEQLRERHPDVR